MTTEYSLPRLVNKVYLLKSEERHERAESVPDQRDVLDYSISVSAFYYDVFFTERDGFHADRDSVSTPSDCVSDSTASMGCTG